MSNADEIVYKSFLPGEACPGVDEDIIFVNTNPLFHSECFRCIGGVYTPFSFHGSGIPFDSFVARWSQSTTDAPVFEALLQNDLGLDLVWTRTIAGIYVITNSESVFDPDNMAGFIQLATADLVASLTTRFFITSGTTIEIDVQNSVSAYVDLKGSAYLNLQMYF